MLTPDPQRQPQPRRPLRHRRRTNGADIKALGLQRAGQRNSSRIFADDDRDDLALDRNTRQTLGGMRFQRGQLRAPLWLFLHKLQRALHQNRL